jgi:hypothetical protein
MRQACRRALLTWPTQGRRVSFLLLLAVSYTKGETLDPSRRFKIDRDVGQKPKHFERDAEWRLVAVLEGGGRDLLPNEVKIQVGPAASFAREWSGYAANLGAEVQ